MILYHGSRLEVARIDLECCRPNKDFGRGFYLTSLKEQAIEWAVKVTRRNGKGDAVLNIYEFNEDVSDLNYLAFSEPDSEWAQFIINNRNRTFQDFQNRLSNHDNKYDLVHGLVANDDISTILETFLLGILPVSQLSEALIYKKLNDQYSFHTAKALTHLTFMGSETYADR
jgi:hypothetical protein